jgi:hypothetical protein
MYLRVERPYHVRPLILARIQVAAWQLIVLSTAGLKTLEVCLFNAPGSADLGPPPAKRLASGFRQLQRYSA